MKENSKVNISTFLLILSLIIIIFMGGIIHKLYNENVNDSQNDLETSSSEKVNIDSEYGEAISYYLTKTWLGLEMYNDNVAEFQNVKDAPKDYLAYCAAWDVMYQINDIYSNYAELDDFNDSLIKLFGNEADNLLDSSDIENVFFVEKNKSGTYSFGGFDGSETRSNDYIINKIEKQDNIFTVTLYEYKSVTDDMPLDLADGESTQNHFYDKNDNLILSTTTKAEQNGNITRYKDYDEDGNEINSIKHLLLTKYEDKLSVRTITLEFDSDNYSFKMLNNKLEK